MPTRRDASRTRGDDGSALLEAAIAAPILFLFVFGILEFGLVFRDYLTIGDGASDAVKFLSIEGKKATADYTAVSLLRQDLANIPETWIDRIVVFKATSAAGGSPVAQVPPGCKTGLSSTALKCNVYTTVHDVFLAIQNTTGPPAMFTCSSGTEAACGWNPTTRVDGPLSANVEYVGIYLKLKRPMLTRIVGSEFNLEIAAVQRIEPGQLTG